MLLSNLQVLSGEDRDRLAHYCNTRRICQAQNRPMMAVFVPVTFAGFLGPQTRDSSITLNFFWAWWWPGYLLLFAFIGRLWCAVCPFMITAEWLRRLSLWLFPRQQLPWPTRWLNRWGAWVLFGGFGVIYLWEKLWDLPHQAYLSAWLLLVITAGAAIFAA